MRRAERRRVAQEPSPRLKLAVRRQWVKSRSQRRTICPNSSTIVRSDRRISRGALAVVVKHVVHHAALANRDQGTS